MNLMKLIPFWPTETAIVKPTGETLAIVMM